MSIIESDTTLLDRLVGIVPEHYRRDLTRLGERLHERLPPTLVKQRIDALEKHLDTRLDELEGKLNAILRLLEKRPT